MEIKDENYVVSYDENTCTVNFAGALRLTGLQDYAHILKLLNDIAEREPSKIILNLQELNFLNSSGISMLSKFVIGMRKRRSSQVIVLGSRQIPWQGKSLKNLQRLMPALKLELQ